MSEDKTTNHDKELVEETERKSHNVLQGGFPKNVPLISGITHGDIAHIPLDHVVATDGKTIFGIKPKDIPEDSSEDSSIDSSIELLKNIIAQLNGDHDFSKDPRLASLRIEALKIATEMALKINHFEPDYSIKKDPIEAVLNDVDIVHKIADRNLKYIMGEQE